MKVNILLLSIIGIFISCNQTEKKPDNVNNVETQKNSTLATKSERQILIEELKRFQEVFTTNDQEKIADILDFPISNEKLGIYIENNQFNKELKQNDNKVTRDMFKQSYKEISESLQIEQFNQLFKSLDINELLNKDILEHKTIIKAEPCYRYYTIKIENNLVILTLGSNSNEDFKSKLSPEDDILENDSSICEHILWWIFKFDGNHLHFKEISGAG